MYRIIYKKYKISKDNYYKILILKMTFRNKNETNFYLNSFSYFRLVESDTIIIIY